MDVLEIHVLLFLFLGNLVFLGTHDLDLLGSVSGRMQRRPSRVLSLRSSLTFWATLSNLLFVDLSQNEREGEKCTDGRKSNP